MQHYRVSAIGRLVATVSLLGLGACATQPPTQIALNPSDRSPVGGRSALVGVPQREIQALVPREGGGATLGLVGALVDISVDKHRTNVEETAITPVRNGLDGYDFDRRALASARATLRQLPWLGVQQVSFSNDFRDDSISAFLDKSPAPEAVLVSYTRIFDSKFSFLGVAAVVQILSKKPPSGAPESARILIKNERYFQAIACRYPLAGADGHLQDNARRWAADGSAATRQALALGLQCLSELIPLSLENSAALNSEIAKGGLVKVGNQTGSLAYDANRYLIFVAGTPVG
jgi:hypothetical protein